jgi:hypothetical protein
VRGWSFSWNVSNNMGTVLFQYIIYKTSNFLTGTSTYTVKVKKITTGTTKVKLGKAMELAELGLYKKKNGFEGAQDVLDFYKKTFKKQEMEPFSAKEVIDPQEAEESSITIVKPTKVI